MLVVVMIVSIGGDKHLKIVIVVVMETRCVRVAHTCGSSNCAPMEKYPSSHNIFARVRKRGARVIVMIHRQEALALLGIPLFRYINIGDAEELLRAVRMTPPDRPIDLILHTPDGLVLASEQIARALCNHPAKVTVFVPHYAMSGGTLIALAADEIVMDPHAVLGPGDPQLGEYRAASILRAPGYEASRPCG